MTDEGGVLENLPRSRPGQRSNKRTAAAKPSRSAPKQAKPSASSKKAKPRAKASTAKPRTAKPRSAPKAAKPAAGTRRVAGAAAGEKPMPAGAEKSGSAVGDVLGAVTSVAGSVARVGYGITREVLRRIPRP